MEAPPSQFYTGLVAQLYAPLRGTVADPEPYARFIGRSGEPALELGCGDGDPLLDLRGRGLDVEGLDSSADMLDRCRRRASERGVDVVLHEAAIEEMDLGRTYRTIFLAGPTFNLLPDDAVTAAALSAIARHLDDAGRVMIPLFVPPPVPETALGQPREHRPGDGSVMRFSTIASHHDPERRVQSNVLRYELVRGDQVQVLEREWTLHWHGLDGFTALVEASGLTVDRVVEPTGTPATADSQASVFFLSKPRSGPQRMGSDDQSR